MTWFELDLVKMVDLGLVCVLGRGFWSREEEKWFRYFRSWKWDEKEVFLVYILYIIGK